MTTLDLTRMPGGPVWQRFGLARMSGAAWLILPACLVLAFALLVPLAYLLALSFAPASEGSHAIGATFTLDNYIRLFEDDFYWWVLFRTLALAAVSTAICTVLGFLTAHFLWRVDKRWRGLLTLVVLAPLLVSIVARTYGWMVLLGDTGLINSVLLGLGLVQSPVRLMFTDFAIVVAMVHVLLPYMVLSILSGLDRLDGSLADAARTLGASDWGAVRDIILPLAMPGIAAGVTLVFSLAASSYITPALMGGSGASTLTTLIYQQFVLTYSWQFGSVLVALLLAATMIIVTALIFVFSLTTKRWSAA